MQTRIVIIGHGMVGHRFLAELTEVVTPDSFDITVIGEEPRLAYDRVHLSSFFEGVSPEALAMCDADFASRHGVRILTGDAAVAIDRDARTVQTAAGAVIAYDHLVLATGSYPFVPPLPGVDLAGSYVYRTIEDLEAIRQRAELDHVRAGVVIGGGLLGLEAANALRLLGLETHIVEMAPRLMPVQLDDGASRVLRHRIEALGLQVHCGASTTQILGTEEVTGLELGDGTIHAGIVVVSAGIRPRDQLARACGLAIGERGGVLVGEDLRTSDPAISAIGEVAALKGRCLGLVAPGYDMARVLARRIAGTQDAVMGDIDLSTQLKLIGIDVASFGDAFGAAPSSAEIVWADAVAGIYKKLVVDRETGAVIGGMLVGDNSNYAMLRLMALGEVPTPSEPSALITPGHSTTGVGVDALPDSAPVCTCENITAGRLREAIGDGQHTIGDLKRCTGAGSGCGGCVPIVSDLLKVELRKRGEDVSDALCRHFAMSRQGLYDLVRFHRHRSWAAVVEAHGSGGGCEICRPAVASILASLANGYILDGDQASIQDTNDHALANMQRDGTYSVVPRVPGGEILPDQLIALGQIAKDFGLYVKITGGQRIDLLGARLDQLPMIWQRVIDAGMESGHAYGKAMRTVKSCVGSTWCRYGVQDSVGLAVLLENRYRGLRAPHKIKLGVSGCSRECAEAQSKDIGVIATERGWNLYVCGNGGARPRHAVLLAVELDTDTLIRTIDRVLAYYIRTADRLQRTANWFEQLQGGLAHLQSVVIDDSLGIAADLEAEIQLHVDSYECEWAATLASPERLRRFITFVNRPGEPDPNIVMIEERGQLRPARAEETAALGASI